MQQYDEEAGLLIDVAVTWGKSANYKPQFVSIYKLGTRYLSQYLA